MEKSAEVLIDTVELKSELLNRVVRIDLYLPSAIEANARPFLLLLNDGQDLVTMEFQRMLERLYWEQSISPVICVGIHCGEDRRSEYGISASPDHEGRGAKAGSYEQFVLTELLPFISGRFHVYNFREKAFAGFSLGGLSALDIVWNNPGVFSKAGIFSGALWWRSRDKQDKEYNQYTDRIMHKQIKAGKYHPGLKFFSSAVNLMKWKTGIKTE